jgi:hypothetical protein
MLRRWKQARRGTLLGGQGVITGAAAMFRPDRQRQIDAVIDFFGGARDVRTAVRARNSKMFITDGPFAETKEQPGGVHVIGCGSGSPQPPYRAF